MPNQIINYLFSDKVQPNQQLPVIKKCLGRLLGEVERQLAVRHLAQVASPTDALEDDPLHRGHVGDQKRIVTEAEQGLGAHLLAGHEDDAVQVETCRHLLEGVDIAVDKTLRDVLSGFVAGARTLHVLRK